MAAMHQLMKMYQKLHDTFGPQHWWPGETPFEVMVGAVLTQNTNWLNVSRAIDNLKGENLLTLLQSTVGCLAQIWIWDQHPWVALSKHGRGHQPA